MRALARRRLWHTASEAVRRWGRQLRRPTDDTDFVTANVCAPSRASQVPFWEHPGEAALDDLAGDCFFARKLRSLIAMTGARVIPH
jgi:hypothetical protein